MTTIRLDDPRLLTLGLFALDRLAPSERERAAYLAGNVTLAAFIGDANDAEDDVEALQEQLDSLTTLHQALQADIQTAVSWMLSDKCRSLEGCKELAKRFQARLAVAPQ